MFLLYAHDRSQRKVILERLDVLAYDQNSETEFLKIWAKTEDNWKNIILEALCLIQVHRIINELGFDHKELESQYLPKNRYVASNIHVIVRLLYEICEQFKCEQSKQLIDSIKKKYSKLNDFTFTDNGEHLEMYFMHWIDEGVIDIGQPE